MKITNRFGSKDFKKKFIQNLKLFNYYEKTTPKQAKQ